MYKILLHSVIGRCDRADKFRINKSSHVVVNICDGTARAIPELACNSFRFNGAGESIRGIKPVTGRDHLERYAIRDDSVSRLGDDGSGGDDAPVQDRSTAT